MATTSRALDFRIDKLTRSIENAVTGDRHPTLVLPITQADTRKLKKTDWLFDWKKEAAHDGRTVYKLVITGNENVLQGMVSVEDKGDHIFLHLIESSGFNRGRRKVYVGVPGNLVAFACKLAMECGYDGFVSFEAKSGLIAHYQQNLGASILFRNYMVIESAAAQKLLARYYPQTPEL